MPTAARTTPVLTTAIVPDAGLQLRASLLDEDIKTLQRQTGEIDAARAAASKDELARLDQRGTYLDDRLARATAERATLAAAMDAEIAAAGAEPFLLADATHQIPHEIRRGRFLVAKRLFRQVAAASPVWLERELSILRTRVGRMNQLGFLFELFQGAPPGALDRLRLIAKAAEIGLEIGRRDEALAMVRAVHDRVAPGQVRFGPSDNIGANLSIVLDAEFRAELGRIKYKGAFETPMPSLAAAAAVMADRIDLDELLADRLFDFRADRSLSRPAWERRFRIGCCLEQLIQDRPKFATTQGNIFSYAALVDPEDFRRALADVDTSEGLLIATWHGGMRTATIDLIETLYPTAITVQAADGDPERVISIKRDPAAALMSVIRALIDGKTVIMFPDGKYGNRSYAAPLCGRRVPTATGAALAAYESGCACVWFTALPQGDGFAPVVAVAPKKARREKFETYLDRWLTFYWAQIETVMTGDPRNMILGQWGTLARWEM